ncbi:transposable element Tcb1 transposase [Trichonephila clavipes]|nr:transposable element Tcb1 transposase [Trichonephila clavipes]
MKTDNFWKKVIFSDESKFNIFGSDGRRTVWRKPNTALDPKNLRPTLKHGGGSVMVWGRMASNGSSMLNQLAHEKKGRPNLRWIDGLEKDLLILRTRNLENTGRKKAGLEKAS